MDLLNPFSTNPAFSMASLTKAINILPNQYGLVGQKNIFPGRGVTQRTIIVEEQNGVLNLLKTQPVGAEGQGSQKNKLGKRTVRSFVIPHIPLEDTIFPQEYDGVRAFGQENQADPLVTIMNNHLQAERNKHAITLEFLRMGALKGVILDADGSVLYNLFTEFGLSAKEIDFALATATTNVAGKCREVKRWIEQSLMGEVATGIECLCSAEFFDAFIGHVNVEKFYLAYVAAQQLVGGDARNGFVFEGIKFQEYNATATDAAGTVRRFIASGDAHFYPVGTQASFETLYAPGTFLETVNTIGLELYAKQEPRKYNKGIDLYTESNPLPICYRPKLLVRAY